MWQSWQVLILVWRRANAPSSIYWPECGKVARSKISAGVLPSHPMGLLRWCSGNIFAFHTDDQRLFLFFCCHGCTSSKKRWYMTFIIRYCHALTWEEMKACVFLSFHLFFLSFFPPKCIHSYNIRNGKPFWYPRHKSLSSSQTHTCLHAFPFDFASLSLLILAWFRSTSLIDSGERRCDDRE